MDLREKLRQLERTSLSHPKSHPQPSLPSYPLEQTVSGGYQRTESGSYFLRQTTWPLEYEHGPLPLAAYLETSPTLLAVAGKSTTLQDLDPRSSLFLDTETTGLSGGTGTVTFLIGVGFFTDDAFCLQQYFISNPGEEAAILRRLNEQMATHDLLVTYNGKTFDIPTLVNRNLLHRMQTRMADMPHLDLLFTARRLWKHRLPECSLSTVQDAILRAPRNGDIPSYQIPQIYFDYLRSRDARPLKAVFYHNEQDILSLVALAARACQMFANPDREEPEDLLAIAAVYDSLAEYEKSIPLYADCLARPLSDILSRQVLFRMGMNYKRLGKWSQAAEVWQRCIGEKRFHPLPYIELAKYLEHRKHDYGGAMALVERALKELSVFGELRLHQAWEAYRADLCHRRQRLLKKATRHSTRLKR